MGNAWKTSVVNYDVLDVVYPLVPSGHPTFRASYLTYIFTLNLTIPEMVHTYSTHFASTNQLPGFSQS